MPRKCKDFNWKLFHGQINTENRLCKMQYSDGSCKVCSNVENVEHILTTCSGLDTIWNVTECIIKNHIDSGFAITYTDKMAGYFKMSKGTEFINVLLSITRWVIWKRRNNIKYDAMDTDIQKGISMLKEEVKIHINNLKRITRSKLNIKNSFQKILEILR